VNALCTCQGLMSGGSEERPGKEGGAAGQPPTLRAQLEFFFSEENISRDPLLRSSLDKDGYAPPRPAAPPPGGHVLRRSCELPAPPSTSCELRTAKCDRSGPGGGRAIRFCASCVLAEFPRVMTLTGDRADARAVEVRAARPGARS